MRTQTTLVIGALWAFAAAALAEPYVYPAHGQSSKRQAKDEAHCASWAKTKTGFDPTRPAPGAVAPSTQVTGSGARVAGALGGALIGGASGGSAGTGALIGAGVGGLTKRAMNHRDANRQNEANAQAYQAARAAYDQARAACLTGRGYSVR
jgi:hypothetical protein